MDELNGGMTSGDDVKSELGCGCRPIAMRLIAKSRRSIFLRISAPVCSSSRVEAHVPEVDE